MRHAALLLVSASAVLLTGCDDAAVSPARDLVKGDSSAGKAAVIKVSCGVCHAIPGVPGAHGAVGPSLDGFAARSLIGGVAPNRPATLARWVRDAPSISPSTGMPPMPLSDEQADDVVAFLYTLR